jgi:hypothetical protein
MVAPGRLKLTAPSALLEEFTEQVRAAKADLLAALAPAGPAPLVTDRADTLDPTWWRREFTIRTLDWILGGNRSQAKAQRLAWGDLQNRWHRLHGENVHRHLCAGCGEPIGGLAALDLADGNRVHIDKLDCLLSFGERWRNEATAALVAMGLSRLGSGSRT